MHYYLSGLTGGRDQGPFRVDSDLEQFLLPGHHTVLCENRTIEVVAGQWEMAVVILANWEAVHRGAVSFRGGDKILVCSICSWGVVCSSELVEGSGVVFCAEADC